MWLTRSVWHTNKARGASNSEFKEVAAIDTHPAFKDVSPSCICTTLQTRAEELVGGAFEPVDEAHDRDIDLMTLALTPDTWLVCGMNYLREKGHFFQLHGTEQ